MTRKKLLSLLLTLALLASLLPAAALSALAAESGAVSVSSWAELVAAAANNGASIILDGDVTAPENAQSITVPAETTVTIDLNGHVIDAKQNQIDVITVTGTLTLKDSKPEATHGESSELPAGGVITGSKEDGVEVTKTGTFTMEGGTISGKYYGVYVNGGAFTMNGGTISGNECDGVYIDSDNTDEIIAGSFVMSGEAQISGNGYNGVKVREDGTFTMSGGTISGNYYGVYAPNGGTFTMSGGTISENESYGVEVREDGGFTMSGGTICGNEYDGVYVWYSTFTMSDGKISGNGKANDGYDYAGVYVDDGTFTMRGGTISGNPYGVWVIDYGDDDEANSDEKLQAKVTDDDPTETGTGFFLSGAPVFSGNAEADVYLETYVDDDEDDEENDSDQSPELRSMPVIHIDGALATTQITVAVSGDIPEDGRAITSGLKENGSVDSFRSAMDGYLVKPTADGEAMLVRGVMAVFEAGEDSDEVYTITTDVDTEITLLAADTFTAPAGKAFEAWKCEADGEEYAAGDPYTVTADVTFTALWKDSGGNAPVFYGGSPSTYQVKTEGKTANGTVTISPSAAAAGTTVKLTATPDAGYTLDTLSVKDASGVEVPLTQNDDGTWSFTMPAKDVTVSATFKPVGTNPFEGFKDLDPDAWYAEGVAYVLEKGYMQGLGDGIFDPDGRTTRGMAATLLWNMEGKPEPTAASTFADVEPDAWYAKAVAWAEEQGIVEGWTDAETGEKVFKPGELVTREAFATMLYRYASKLYGLGFKGLWAFRLDFPDADQISDWAYEAVCWMVMNGIMNGMDGLLNPQGYSTRAQIATMVYRYDSLPAEA